MDAFLVRDGAEGQAFPGEGRGGQASRGGGGAERRRVGETSLLSDLQFPRHLTEGAGQTKGEGCPVLPDGALEGGREVSSPNLASEEASPPALGSHGPRARTHLDAVALAHAGAKGVQASGQVGRAAALAEVVGDAAGEAQRGEGAAQTWGGHGALRAGASGRLRLGQGRGGVRGARGAGPRGN